MAKRYLNVKYEDRDLAKRLGARWDAGVKRWYCAPGSDLELIFRWRPPAANAAVPVARPAHNQNFELPLAG